MITMYKCKNCNETCTTKSALNSHMLSHSGKKPYACTSCDKTFSRSNYLPIHMSVHSGERPYKCSFCGKTFSQSATLRKHRKLHEKMKCSVCCKTFSKKGLFVNHICKHSGNKASFCRLCGEGYSDIGNGCIHEKIHADQHPFHCLKFDKGFSHKVDHERHYGTVPAYICVLCNKGYKRLKILRNHAEKVHSNQILFGCGFCQRKFHNTLTFTNHMKSYFVHGHCADNHGIVNSDNGEGKDVNEVIFPKANVFRVENDLIIIVISEHDVLSEGKMCHKKKNVKDRFRLLTSKTISSNVKNLVSYDKEIPGFLSEDSREVTVDDLIDTSNMPNLEKKMSRPIRKTIRKTISEIYNGTRKGELGCRVFDAKSTRKKPGKRTRKYCQFCNKFFISAKNYEMHIKKHKNFIHCKSNKLKSNCVNHKLYPSQRSLVHLGPDEAFTDEKSHHRLDKYSEKGQYTYRFCEAECDLGNPGTNISYKIEKEHLKHNVCHELSFAKSDNSLMHMMEFRKQNYCRTCHVCCKSFSTEESFSSHKMEHEKEQLYACSICGKILKELQGVSRQLNSTEQPSHCNDCLMEFSNVKSDNCNLEFHENKAKGCLKKEVSFPKISLVSGIDRGHLANCVEIIVETKEQDSPNPTSELKDFSDRSKGLQRIENGLKDVNIGDFLPSLESCIEIEVTELT
ncbi:zinc finger protein 845-like [Palaemon carinicauda]|uniref:zinc finger protein 845-like n=1 Tax=Palaemon carinicauda TaxID=392227 RepID=UPI0035B61EB4